VIDKILDKFCAFFIKMNLKLSSNFNVLATFS